VDEITAVGDASFRKKSNDLFLSRMSSAGAIVVNHTMSVIRDLCTKAMVLDDGQLHWFDDVDEAIRFHNELMLK
jgi:capsular polysaccharide transport system ATP-binding protein